MKDQHIAIAGGGIGGLTLAIALARKGISSTVLERAPNFETVGAGITMQINAMLALQHIGVAEQVEAAGNRLSKLVLNFKDGKQIFTSDMTKPAQKYGVPFVSIHRAQLHETLCSSVPEGTVTFGFQVESYAEQNGKVIVSASDSRQVEATALIGADGLRSNVRRQLLGDEPLRYSGCTSWRGVVENQDFIVPDTGIETWGDKSITGIIPIGDNNLYWFATKVTAPGQSDPDDPRDSLQQLLKGWHYPLEELVSATPPDSILRTDIYDRPPRIPWSKGRVALLGDAAHAMTPHMGQGGGQAVEDAVILAEALARASSPQDAFKEYEEKRYERTKTFVDTSRRISKLAHGMTPQMRFARRWVVPYIPAWFRELQFDKVFRFEI